MGLELPAKGYLAGTLYGLKIYWGDFVWVRIPLPASTFTAVPNVLKSGTRLIGVRGDDDSGAPGCSKGCAATISPLLTQNLRQR